MRPSWSLHGGLGAFKDCGSVVEFFATELSDDPAGAVIRLDGAMLRR